MGWFFTAIAALAALVAISRLAPRSVISVVLGAAGQFLMICALDYGPISFRRSVLKHEYQGEALEQRLQMKIGGGVPMLLALVEMALVNLRPQLSEGAKVPSGIALHTLDGSGTVDLLSLSRPGVPLVLNFGSCS